MRIYEGIGSGRRKKTTKTTVFRQHRRKWILLDAELSDVPLIAEHTAECDARIAEGEGRLLEQTKVDQFAKNTGAGQ